MRFAVKSTQKKYVLAEIFVSRKILLQEKINLSRKTMSLSWQFRMICQSSDMAIT